MRNVAKSSELTAKDAIALDAVYGHVIRYSVDAGKDVPVAKTHGAKLL